MSTRRRFISLAPWAGASLLAACGGDKAAPSGATQAAAAPAGNAPAANTSNKPLVDPADPAAVGLAYIPRGSESKHPRYAAPAACGNCIMYGGKAGEMQGTCALFMGQHVAVNGWCSAYNRRG
jgi:High potential iron-sulfur protein